MSEMSWLFSLGVTSISFAPFEATIGFVFANVNASDPAEPVIPASELVIAPFGMPYWTLSIFVS